MKSCPTSALFTNTPEWTGLELNSALRVERADKNLMTHDMHTFEQKM